jgi:hypothetical protein
MEKKYIVEYQFTGTLQVVKKEFVDFIQAMQFQSEILKKYKNKLNYCIYK